MDFYLFLPGQWWDRSKPVRQLYEEMIEQAVLAERLGYDGIWLAEQNLVSFLAAPDPLQLAAMIAQRTERIRIGVAVFVLPFHHPLRLAGAISQIDQLSGGRFDVAAGRGASPYQMRQFQAEMEEADSRAMFAEHLRIMVDHWSADDALSHDGRFFTYPNATVLPPPLQLPHPPLWIAALSTRSMEWAVKLGFDSNFIFSPFREPFTHVENVYGAFTGAMEECGRPRTSARFAVNRMTYVGEPADTNDVLRYVLMNHRIIDQQLAGAERVNRGDYVVESAVKQDEPELEQMHANIAFGEVDEVREKLARYAQLGVDVFSAWHNVGQSHEQVVRSMEVFAKEIMPGLR
ncbi:MAG TPA: LLM class flavin-dependent oxidoreductase [Solirubrobacteraceae bacterium]|jgi:alkanesulfonate monooxygenase SsuD/methylene tetrahydromethanopterin reductase-like flavin-dependent oxidoreductase (luciferase family)|nr:LLM class flavin-dependent oxidoreductase [Solirubrobacteraceae bacterium]